MKTRIIISGL